MKGALFSLLRVVISVSLLALLFWFMRGDILDIGLIIARCNFVYIALGLALLLINVFMLAYRLKLIFEGENLKIEMAEAVQLTYIGYFFNNFMPTAVGGDIVKAHYASGVNGKTVQSYASVFMDRFIGLYSFLLVAALALAVDKGHFKVVSIKPLVSILLLLGLVGVLVVTNTAIARAVQRFFAKFKMMRLGEKLHSVYAIVHDYRNRGDVVVKSMIVSMAAQTIYFFVVYLFFLSLGHRISMINIFLIMPVVTFMSMIPSIGGLGVREGAIVAFFAPIIGKEPSFAVSILLLFSLFFLSLIGGVIYVWWGVTGVRRKDDRLEKIEKEAELAECRVEDNNK